MTSAQGRASSAYTAASQTAQEAYASRHVVGEKVAYLRDAGYGLAGDQYTERKKQAMLGLLRMAGPARARAMLAVRELVKETAVADPDMWTCASTRFKDLIDLFWADLTVYIETIEADTQQTIKGKLETTVEGLGALGDKPMFCSPRWFRAFILYHYLPFDKSIFGQVKDPVFWLFTMISLVPSYGIRCMFFFLILLLILTGRPPDEYQLVGYIISFKGTQFISSGIVLATIAAVKYYLCVHPDGTHDCATKGPGADQDVMWTGIDFLASCIFVWIAFICLPCSARSAGVREIGIDSEAQVEGANEDKCCGKWDGSRGGRLAGLLGWDMLAFLLSCALLAGLVFVDSAHLRPGGSEEKLSVSQADVTKEVGRWTFRTAFYWARLFYALLSFPFVVFFLPVMSGVLTHTTYTGYNRNGKCVPFMLHPMPAEPGAAE